MTDELHTTWDLAEPAVAKSPGDFFDRLRTTCPVAHTEKYDGFWILSRYKEVYEAARNPETFSSASGVIIPKPPAPPFICLEQDDPEHHVLRRQMQSWFSPGRIEELEGAIRSIVTGLIDTFADSGAVDLATALAEPVPPLVIALILGLPDDEWPWFRARNEGFQAASASGDMDAALVDVLALGEYLGKHLQQRRSNPTADMLSDVLTIRVDGHPLSDEEAVSLSFLLLAAGHETTVGALGGMLYHVASNPGLLERLAQEPALVDSAVEEALRLEPPLPGLARTITTETEIAGISMPAGERVMLLWAAANRDPSVFDQAETFVVERPNNRHLAFGAGVHRCVGAPLARLEMRIVLEEVVRRLPGLRVVDDDMVEVTYTASRTYRSLPVAWDNLRCPTSCTRPSGW